MRNTIIKRSFNADLQEIYSYIIEYFGESYVDAIQSKIERRILTLTLFPECGRLTVDKKYWYVNSGKNKLFYNFNNKTVNFIRIIDSRMAGELNKIMK